MQSNDTTASPTPPMSRLRSARLNSWADALESAMKLNRLIMNMLDWPCTMAERLRDWLEAGRVPQKQNPLSRRCYLTSEAHMSGYRLIVGFENLKELDAAHSFLARELKPNTEAQGHR